MSNIHVNRGETKLGLFSEEEIREGLASGRFLPSDLFWRDGMATWLPLAQFPEISASGTPSPAIPPLQSTTATPTFRIGLPWDRRQELGLFSAFIETLKLFLTDPGSAFAQMKRDGGLIEPLIYGVIGGSVGCLAYFLFTILLSSFGFMSHRDPLAGLMGLGFGTILIIVLLPVLLPLGFVIGSAILHVCLMLVGGAKQPFETTFRVMCFAAGSTYPLMIIPLCGGMISGIWCIVLECIGLARAHETSTGKALLAVLLPLIVCCGGGFFLAIVFGMLGGMAHH